MIYLASPYKYDNATVVDSWTGGAQINQYHYQLCEVPTGIYFVQVSSDGGKTFSVIPEYGSTHHMALKVGDILRQERESRDCVNFRKRA